MGAVRLAGIGLPPPPRVRLEALPPPAENQFVLNSSAQSLRRGRLGSGCSIRADCVSQIVSPRPGPAARPQARVVAAGRLGRVGCSSGEAGTSGGSLLDALPSPGRRTGAGSLGPAGPEGLARPGLPESSPASDRGPGPRGGLRAPGRGGRGGGPRSSLPAGGRAARRALRRGRCGGRSCRPAA